MENDTFGGAILAWVKSLRRARHGMPGQRHGPVQGKLHPRRGAGIELPASLRQGLRQGQHRGTDGRMTPPFYLAGEESPWLALRCSPPPLRGLKRRSVWQ